MANFMVNTTSVENAANELENLNNQFGTAIEELVALESTLNGLWDGEANDAFHKNFDSDKIQMNNFKTAVTNYVTSLRNISAEYKTAESQNVQLLSQRNYK